MTFRSTLSTQHHTYRTTRRLILAIISFGAQLAIAREVMAQSPFDSNYAEPTPPPRPPHVVTAANWEETDAPPPGYHVENRMRRGLVIKGAALLLVSYGASAFFAAGVDDARALWAPIAGPFVQVARTPNSPAAALLVVDGVVQVIGAGMITYGLAVPRGVLVPDAPKAQLSFVPIFSTGSAGLGLVGTF
jgi:hypothetical protein